MVRLLFSANSGPFSKVIRTATWGDYSHVDFIYESVTLDTTRNDHGYPVFHHNPLLLGATFGKGVCLREMPKVIETSTKYAIAEVDVSPMALEYAASQLGKKYDYLALVGFPLRKDIEDQDRWFCTELVTWAIERAGLDMFTEKVSRITPRDLYIHPYVRVMEVHHAR